MSRTTSGRTSKRARRRAIALAIAATSVIAGAPFLGGIEAVHAATFTVNDIGDAPDASAGNGSCATAGGVCTLRAAIEEANALAGADVITFAIPDSPAAPGPVKTITLSSVLPTVGTAMTIDATTQPGATCGPVWPPAPKVVVDVNNIVNIGVNIVSPSPVAVRGLVVTHGGGTLVQMNSPTTLECNFIGTDATGMVIDNSTSPSLRVSGAGSVIGTPGRGNLIAGGANQLIEVGGTGSVYEGNYVNTNVLGGKVQVGNVQQAFTVGTSGSRIGGTAPGAGNVIRYNTPGTTAILVYAGTGTSIRGNDIRAFPVDESNATAVYNKFYLGINIGPGTGFPPSIPQVNLNHAGVVAGPNNYQNFPVLSAAWSSAAGTRVVGTLDGIGGRTYDIDVFATPVCHASGFGDGAVFLGTFPTSAGANGVASFNNLVAAGLGEASGISTTATDTVTGDTSEMSFCRAASTDNLTWNNALPVTTGATQYFTDRLQEKWFRFPVTPGATVKVSVTGLPGTGVSLHRDPLPFYNGISNPSSAAVLSAEAADTGFLPSGTLPSGTLPSGTLPSGTLPSGTLETGFLPSGTLPSGTLPSGTLPSGTLPSGTLPSGTLPSGTLPSGTLPSGTLPSGTLPSGTLPSGTLPSGTLPSGTLPSGTLDAYGTAARRSLLGMSANPYWSTQTVERNVYDLQEDLYVRVVGPYSLATPFTLSVNVTGGSCPALAAPSGTAVPNGATGAFSTVILTDSARLAGTPTEVTAALAKLQTLASRPEVHGTVIDLASAANFPTVAFARGQADSYLGCPSAKNLLATEIKRVIDTYRTASSGSLAYVVLAGGADVIPFHQVSDVAGLASERDYVPPVKPNTASEAGLRLGLVAGQDFYGSDSSLTVGSRTIAIPGLAVGRLVDRATDVTAAVDAYLAAGGVVTPHSSLVTGYDFVGDAAVAVKAEADAGTSSTADTLIQAPGDSPSNALTAWTASQMRTKILAGNHDLMLLSGHFDAGKLLAADYKTTLDASEIAASSVDLARTIVIALGCHSGYAVPNGDFLEGGSPDPDWARTFLRKGSAGFIAATGYAYGDTELTEYGERLVVNVAQEMRTGNGPVSLGEALVKAKRAYLAETPQITGIDEKTVVEMTLYGLPMMKVDMPGARLAAPAISNITGNADPVAGSSVGLRSTVRTISPTLTGHTKSLVNLSGGGNVTTTYFSGRDGVVANPSEPILPKQIDGVDVPGQVLRGVALRGGTYTDQSGITPLTSSPNTETSGPHTSFNTNVFYPNQTWTPNFTDALKGAGPTRLLTYPAQFKSTAPGATDGTLRTYNNLELAFYYLPAAWPGTSGPVKAAGVSPSPNIFGATATVTGSTVTFNVNALNDGSAGVQSVWVLYTGLPGSPLHGTWAPVDLVQDVPSASHPDADASLWTGTLTLPPGANAGDLRYMVHAVNGAGLTSLSTNLGAYYGVADTAVTPPVPVASAVVVSGPGTVGYKRQATFTATLYPSLSGRVVQIEVAGQQAQTVTNASGVATANFTPNALPGPAAAQASFAGDAGYKSSTSSPFAFTVGKDSTSLTVTPPTGPVEAGAANGITATLRDGAARPLAGKSLVFVTNSNGQSFARSVTTDTWGVATLGPVDLPAGTYALSVHFSGNIPTAPPLQLSDPTYNASQGSTSLTINAIAPPTITGSAKNADLSAYAPDTWTKQNVTVHFTCADAIGVTSCTADQTISTEGITPAVNGSVLSTRGVTVNATFGPVKIDKTAPTVAVTSPADGSTIYVGTPLNASFTCIDGGSGVDSCVGTPDDDEDIDTSTPGPKTLEVRTSDRAGNAFTKTVNYSVVAVPIPTISATAVIAGTTTPYVAGTWTKQNVTVHFICADTVDPAPTCPADVTVSAEGTTTAVPGTATNNLGSSATTSFGPIRIDKVAPTIAFTAPTPSASYTAGAAIAAAYTCSDAGSGIGTCVGTVASGQPLDTAAVGPKPFTVTATDTAGNTTTQIVTYNVTPVPLPTITASAKNADGSTYVAGTWTKQSVTVHFTCADAVGVATCTADQTVTAEGTTATVTGTALSTRGATSSTTFGPITIDKTAPTLTLTTPPNGASYAAGTVVNANYACADTGSGIGTCVGTTPSGLAISTMPAGTKTFTVTATDVAGNVTTQSATYTVTGGTTPTAPVVKADMGIAGLEDVGFPTNAVALTGTFTNPGGQGPFTASVRWKAGGAFSSFALANNSQFAAAGVLPTGTSVATVRICNKAGQCGTDDITVRSNVKVGVTPVRECVVDRGASANPRYQARFGYDNTAAYAIVLITVPILDNTFTATPYLRGQPQVFLSGSRRNVFSETFGANGSLTWRLNAKTVTANSSSPRC